MGSRSRRDKDMSDNKAIKKTNQGFRAEKFSISPGEAGRKGAKHLFYSLPRGKNANMSGFCRIIPE